LRILFLHEVNYETKPIFEMHEFPEHLAARDNEIGFVQFPESENNQSLKSKPFKKRIPGRVLPEVNIDLFTPKTRSSGLSGRLLAVFRTGRFFKKVLKDFQPDVVVSFAVPTSGWQSLRAAKQAGVPCLFRALDVSHKIRKSIFSPLILLAETYIYRNADWVSCNNAAMQTYVLRHGAKKGTTSITFPPLDLAHFSKPVKPRNHLRQQLGIDQSAQVILYMGSFFYFSGLPDAIREFANNSMQSQLLLLIGGGEQQIELEQLVKSLRLESRVLFTGMVTFEDLPGYLALGDVAINTLEPSDVSNYALPNKVLQYMAAGLPVVSTELKGLELSLGTESQGLIFREDARAVMAKAISVSHNHSELSALGAANEKLIARNFGLDKSVVDFERQLIQLAGSS